ncbi:hypothetical protein FQZ97_914760 [compost metagenome]
MGGELIGARGAAQAQIDAPRIQGGEGAELLGDHQGRVIGQHHPTGAETNARGPRSQVAQQHRGRRTGDAVHVVVLGHPETGEAQALRLLRQGQGTLQRWRRAGVIVAYRRQVEDGKRGGG